MKKEEKLTVRFTSDLFKKLDNMEKKTGLKKVEIIRYLVFNADDNLNLKKQDLKELNRQLAQIGNNLNQIARHLNKTKEINKEEIGKTLDLIYQVQNTIKKEIL